MVLGILILIGFLVLGLLAAAVVHYLKLRKFFHEQGLQRAKSDTFVDLLFHEHLKNEPHARKMQKRTIGLFCASLLMVHVAMLVCGSCLR